MFLHFGSDRLELLQSNLLADDVQASLLVLALARLHFNPCGALLFAIAMIFEFTLNCVIFCFILFYIVFSFEGSVPTSLPPCPFDVRESESITVVGGFIVARSKALHEEGALPRCPWSAGGRGESERSTGGRSHSLTYLSIFHFSSSPLAEYRSISLICSILSPNLTSAFPLFRFSLFRCVRSFHPLFSGVCLLSSICAHLAQGCFPHFNND